MSARRWIGRLAGQKGRRTSWIVSGSFLVLIALIIGFGAVRQASADGGPAPTALPTNTPVPTATQPLLPTNTQAVLLLAATLTPEIALPPYPLVTPHEPMLIVPESAEPQPEPGLSLVCWPFALAFIVIVVIAASSLLYWRRTSTD